MQQCKEIYFATDIEALNRIALVKKKISTQKPAALMRLAQKLYQESQNDPYDEEMTYILLYRFIKLYNQLMTAYNDPNYVNSMLGKEARKALAQICDLKKNLINRYEELSLKKAAVIKSKNENATVEQEHKTVFNNVLFISCSELFRAFSDGSVNILIIDARSKKDFEESHIKDANCINIPGACIQSGLSAHRLGLALPVNSIEKWDKRDSYDVIILLDWNTCKTNYAASKLDKLRTILVEWDVDRNYKEKPVILNEGYIEWLEMYPMLCTNSVVKFLKVNNELDDLLNLDNIEYPTDAEPKSHEVFKEELAKKITQKDVEGQSHDDILNLEQLVIEQNKQVAKELLIQEQEWKTIHDKISHEYDIAKLEQLKVSEREAEEAISKLTLKEAELLEKKSELTNRFNLAVSFKPDAFQPENRAAKLEDINKSQQEYLDIVKKREAYFEERQKLLDEARKLKKLKPQLPESSFSEKPLFDRGTKPKYMILPTIVDHMDGKLEPVEHGLTGLINIKNTCYMNTIIQCLRHIPEIIEFYCNGDYSNHVHRSPIISNEVAHLIRALWSNLYTVIKPIEFYKKFTSLSPVYKDGYHEDCLEFFLQLYNYLSDDCASDVDSKNFWSETQMSWYKQHGGKKSFYINMFYHQIKIESTCNTCKLVSLKFDIENIFYLPVPDKPFKLEHSMESYLNSKESITCKKCKKVKNVKKTISYYPSILIIALKRHKQDFVQNNVVHYRKNETQCYFPLDNFIVGKCLYTLDAIALHVGNMQSGHYTAACLNPINHRWYLFNDNIVSEIDITDPSFQTKAYAFFYSLNKATPKFEKDKPAGKL